MLILPKKHDFKGTKSKVGSSLRYIDTGQVQSIDYQQRDNRYTLYEMWKKYKPEGNTSDKTYKEGPIKLIVKTMRKRL